MSEDLLAAFGEPLLEQNNSKTPSAAEIGETQSFFDDFNSTTTPALVATQQPDPWADFATANAPADDDDWGDFEGANTSTTTVPELEATVVSAPPKYQYGLDELGSPSAEVPKKQPKPINFDLLSIDNDTAIGGQTGSSKLKRQKAPKDPDVLFDASEESGDDADDYDDEFGNFETAESEAAAPVVDNVIDLLGLDDDLDFTPALASAMGHPMRSFNTLADHKPKEFNIPREFQDEEPWDEIPSGDQNAPSILPEMPKPELVSTQAEAIDVPLPISTVHISDEAVPPTNIPPPSLLLSLFPELLESIDEALLRRISSLEPSLRRQVLERPETATSIRGYLAIIMVCARIIAGRKLRWKRDVLLSQSMRIGPAASGKLSGMKVTSVDKAELAKEEREVAEVLRAWTQQVGRLKAVVADARKASTVGFGVIPELKDSMLVKTAKETEGGVPSAKACALCGLKRNERVVKAEAEVQDSFGEWWIERTNMHRGCRNFWEEHKKSLQQR